MLFFVEVNIEYRGLSQPEFLQILVREAEAAIAVKEKGVIKEIWKVVGERKVYLVVDVESSEAVETMSFSLPLFKELGNQVEVSVTPITEYYNFANFINQAIGSDERYPAKKTFVNPEKEGIFYWLKFTIEYMDMSQDELFSIWAEEAKFALKTQELLEDGLCLWKSVGKREVHVLLRVESPEALDSLSLDLPIMKKMGDQVKIECKSVCPYQRYINDIKKRV
eukprot:gene16872-18577_t